MPDGAAPLATALVAGFGATGKAQAIAALLRRKAAHEQWALISPAADGAAAAGMAGVWFEQVAPGCPCCTGLLPFSAGLTRLLRRVQGSKVNRLLIEGGPEGHIGSVARLLAGAQFRPYVALGAKIAVINPRWLTDPAVAARATLRELGDQADALVASNWDASGPAAREAFGAFAESFDPVKPWKLLEDISPGFAFCTGR